MTYKVTVNGKEIEYGPLVERSSFSEEEWQAIHQEIVKQNQPEVFEKKKDDTDYISAFGALISLEERYEALLEALPQKKLFIRWNTSNVGCKSSRREYLEQRNHNGRCC